MWSVHGVVDGDAARVESTTTISDDVPFLAMRRGPQIAVVTVVRELIGDLWAVTRDVTTTTSEKLDAPL